MQKAKKRLRKIIIAVLGFTVVIIGILLIVTPGPAIIVIPAGLTILATEFPWAEKLLAKIKSKLKRKKQTQN